MVSGLLALLIASVCFGSAAIFVRLAAGIQPTTLTFYRLAFSVIPIAAFAIVTGRVQTVRRPTWAFLAISGVALSLHFFTFIYAVQNTTVANATFLVNTSPVFLGVLAPVFLKERTTKREMLGLACAALGIFLTSRRSLTDFGTFDFALGDVSAIASAILVSFYTLIGRQLRTSAMNAATYVTYVYLFAAFAALPVASALDREVFSLRSAGVMFAMVGLALVPTVLGHGLYNYSLGYVKAVTANLVPLLEPLIASVLALAFFNEIPTSTQILGYALIAASVLYVAFTT